MEQAHNHESYLLVTTTAFDLAAQGYREEGYTCLRTGLERAETLQENGEPRGADLAARYRAALGLYAEKYQARP